MHSEFIFLIIFVIIVIIIITGILIYVFLLKKSIYYSCDTSANCFANSLCEARSYNCYLNDSNCGNYCAILPAFEGLYYQCDGNNCIPSKSCTDYNPGENCYTDVKCNGICSISSIITNYFSCNNNVCQICGTIPTENCFLTNPNCNNTCNNNTCTSVCMGNNLSPLIQITNENDPINNNTPIILLYNCVSALSNLKSNNTNTIDMIPYNSSDPYQYVYLITDNNESIFNGGMFQIISATKSSYKNYKNTNNEFYLTIDNNATCTYKLYNGNNLISSNISILIYPNGRTIPNISLPLLSSNPIPLSY